MARIKLATIEYSSAAEMIANYKAIRGRSAYQPPPIVVGIEPPPAPVVKPPAPVEPPAPIEPPAAPPSVVGIEPPARTSDLVKRKVAAFYGISKWDIESARRTLNVVKPRHIAMAIVKRMTTMSLPEIGRRFGGRDHTTVLHAVKKLERLVHNEWELNPLATIEERIDRLHRLTDHSGKPLDEALP